MSEPLPLGTSFGSGRDDPAQALNVIPKPSMSDMSPQRRVGDMTLQKQDAFGIERHLNLGIKLAHWRTSKRFSTFLDWT